MKNKIPSEGLRLGRDSGSILCDTLKKWRLRTAWGGMTDRLYQHPYAFCFCNNKQVYNYKQEAWR